MVVGVVTTHPSSALTDPLVQPTKDTRVGKAEAVRQPPTRTSAAVVVVLAALGQTRTGQMAEMAGRGRLPPFPVPALLTAVVVVVATELVAQPVREAPVAVVPVGRTLRVPTVLTGSEAVVAALVTAQAPTARVVTADRGL